MHQSHTLTGKVRVSILIPIGDVVRKTNAFGMILSSLDNAHFFYDRARLGKIPMYRLVWLSHKVVKHLVSDIEKTSKIPFLTAVTVSRRHQKSHFWQLLLYREDIKNVTANVVSRICFSGNETMRTNNLSHLFCFSIQYDIHCFPLGFHGLLLLFSKETTLHCNSTDMLVCRPKGILTE